ncbi:hypothetical protein BG003_001514, partial [Podila horticola]
LTQHASDLHEVVGYTMIEAFTLKIENTSPVEQLMMIVLNPNRMVNDSGTIYHDFFPVIWKVLDFAPSIEHASHVVHFDSRFTVVLQETVDHVIYASSFWPVKDKKKLFRIAELDGGQHHLEHDQQDDKSCHYDEKSCKHMASIYNPTKRPADVGLGDEYGNSYLTMGLPVQENMTFNFDAEFAIVPRHVNASLP